MTLDELFQTATGGCQLSDCNHAHNQPFFLHARCHPRAGTWTSIDPHTRIVRVVCKDCRRLVVQVECPAAAT